jgi:hypothetical protein
LLLSPNCSTRFICALRCIHQVAPDLWRLVSSGYANAANARPVTIISNRGGLDFLSAEPGTIVSTSGVYFVSAASVTIVSRGRVYYFVSLPVIKAIFWKEAPPSSQIKVTIVSKERA